MECAPPEYNKKLFKRRDPGESDAAREIIKSHWPILGSTGSRRVRHELLKKTQKRLQIVIVALIAMGTVAALALAVAVIK